MQGSSGIEDDLPCSNQNMVGKAAVGAGVGADNRLDAGNGILTHRFRDRGFYWQLGDILYIFNILILVVENGDEAAINAHDVAGQIRKFAKRGIPRFIVLA